ncbi:MAG: cytochrome c oxidase assembly protein [Armatimonadetes bacterium]|nr:cytochrome c oxidase assembly protein [Armatimonadota bacterium]
MGTGIARAHGEGLPDPGSWWREWNTQPMLLLMLAAVWGFYTRGALAVWSQAGVGRGIPTARAAAFGAGMAVLFLALVSPLDAMSAVLSSAHMVQHMLLMMVAAPLLAYGAPVPAFIWALPARWRQPLAPWIRRAEGWYAPGYRVWQPLAVWGLYALALWVWHMPALYQAALRDRLVHDAQHLVFLLTSLLFWGVLLDPLRRLRMSRGAGVLYLFTTCLHASALGIFLALSPRVWYVDYGATAPLWNLAPLEDQQLAGMIMWIPGCLLYALAATWLFALWLRETEDASTLPGEAEALPGSAAAGGWAAAVTVCEGGEP